MNYYKEYPVDVVVEGDNKNFFTICVVPGGKNV
jgi:hypothetical protein